MRKSAFLIAVAGATLVASAAYAQDPIVLLCSGAEYVTETDNTNPIRDAAARIDFDKKTVTAPKGGEFNITRVTETQVYFNATNGAGWPMAAGEIDRVSGHMTWTLLDYKNKKVARSFDLDCRLAKQLF